MPSVSDWKVPPDDQPKAADYAYDLDAAMNAVVGLRAVVPDDAFTAQTLGTERAGNGVLIRDNGLVLTIGYLITEAESIWLTPITGLPVPGHALAYDQETGFGLVQALAKLDLPALAIGNSGAAQIGARSRPGYSPSRSSPAIGNTFWTRRSSRRRHTPIGAAPR
jgi:S1-C subfamily serine protease